MKTTLTTIGVLLAGAALAAPASAKAADNAKPRLVSATVLDRAAPARTVTVAFAGRDADDVVRGAEIRWGDGQPAQGTSACQLSSSGRSDERRRGKKERFELAYAYLAPGDYTITVRVISGGCGKRAAQRSAPRTLTVHVP